MWKIINSFLIQSKRLGIYEKRQNILKNNLKRIFTNKQFNTNAYKCAKVFADTENKYAFNVLTIFPLTSPQLELKPFKTTYDEDFDSILKKNWRTASATDILETFKICVDYSKLNNINLSDTRFNNLVDGLMDNIEKLTYDEICELLIILTKYPPTESYRSHNFEDIWSALDDICCWKMSDWNKDQLFHLAQLWYQLNLGRMCNFTYEFLNKLHMKEHKLTKNELVHTYFYLNVCRRKKVPFELEDALVKEIFNMSVDEMAVIAMGYFKTQTKIKTPFILECMIDAIKDNANTIHEVSLCALLKVIRFSSNPNVADKMYDLLDSIVPEISRLSLLCCLHIALLGTTLSIFHPESLKSVSQKFVDNITNMDKVRLKDIERLLLALTMFDFDPKTTPDIYNCIYKEMHKEERAIEIEMYPRCLSSALSFLIIKNIYAEKLISTVLHQDFITNTYGKSPKLLPREIFSLDLSVEIECSNYHGNKLNPASKYKSAKWLTEFTPAYDQFKKLSASDKLVLDVIDNVTELAGSKNNLFIHQILPHYAKSDIVLCMDKNSQRFVEPKGFSNYILGDIMRPYDTHNFIWYAIVVVGWNCTIRNTSSPVGFLNMKKRQLTLIGYKPIMVIWNEYNNLNKASKKEYITEKLKLC